ncbi:MAG: hypothetical protein RIR79_579 [Pseudomonadota bacterium]|jgi:trehalose/maltose hydrolase-like predicted phosphorylase
MIVYYNGVRLSYFDELQARVDAAYERAYERANELVSPNSPEFEPLVNRLIEQFLTHAHTRCDEGAAVGVRGLKGFTCL